MSTLKADVASEFTPLHSDETISITGSLSCSRFALVLLRFFALSTYGPRNKLLHWCLYLAIIASFVLVIFYVMTNNKIKCLNSFAITWYCVVYMPFLTFLYELKEMERRISSFFFLMIKNIPYHFICFLYRFVYIFLRVDYFVAEY